MFSDEMGISLISVLQFSVIFGHVPEYGPVSYDYICQTGLYHFATSYYDNRKDVAEARCKENDCDIIVEWTRGKYKGYDIGKFTKDGDKSGCTQNTDMTVRIIRQTQRVDDYYTNSNNTINEEWSSWSSWSTCTKTCGKGEKTRTRDCLFNNNCQGSNIEVEDCNKRACDYYVQQATWNEWSSWTECSKSCGYGKEYRSRACTGNGCRKYNADQSRNCNLRDCVGQWTNWSGCSVSCGEGSQTRSRSCQGNYCRENLQESKKCSQRGCVGRWSNWSGCSVSCGEGSKTRSRSCQGNYCRENLQESKKCSQPGCVGEWSNWSECSVSCGKGSQTRSRLCEGNCRENLRESQECRLQPCLNIPNYGPVDGTQNCLSRVDRSYDNFSMLKNYETYNQAEKACRVQWDVCDIIVEINRSRGLRKSFEIGSTRTQPCQIKNTRDVQSIKVVWQGHFVMYGPVGQNTCLNHGDRFHDSFSQSKTYESLSLAKIYCQKVHHPRCDIIVEIRQPDDGRSRGQLKVVYEIGSTKYTRENPFCPGRHFLGYDEPFRPYDLIVHKIPILSNWSNWGFCSRTCGQGSKTRTRTCSIQGKCYDKLDETSSCNNGPCPNWSYWGPWSQCSVSCGNGLKKRERSCPIQGACAGDQYQSDSCRMQKCTVSGDRSYQTNASSRSSGSTKVNGLRQYGPVQPGVRCSLSRGGALSYSYLYKKQAETHCKSYNCDIITELSNGRFEIGSTTRMKKCKFQSSNIKEQWIKG